MDLAYGLLDSRHPALGILVTRSLLPLADHFDACTMLEALLDTRDKLNLPAEEAYDDLMDSWFDSKSDDDFQQSEDLAEAHQALQAKNQEVQDLKQSLARLNRELQQKEQQQPPPVPHSPSGNQQAAPSSTHPGDPALADLRQRLAQMKDMLKQRHSERNQLRHELQEARQDLEALCQVTQADPKASGDTASAHRSSEEDWLLPEENLVIQHPRVPEFPKDFKESLATWPRSLARAALVLIGRLAAGEQAAFVGVKRLKSNRDFYRQRVGADYRLLFRLHPQSLHVLDLINRKDLERKVKSWA